MVSSSALFLILKVTVILNEKCPRLLWVKPPSSFSLTWHLGKCWVLGTNMKPQVIWEQVSPCVDFRCKSLGDTMSFYAFWHFFFVISPWPSSPVSEKHVGVPSAHLWNTVVWLFLTESYGFLLQSLVLSHGESGTSNSKCNCSRHSSTW